MNCAYWIRRDEALPEDEYVIVFHVKWRKVYHLCFGYFFRGDFIEKNPFKVWKKTDIDYWMPIPVLPKGSR